MSFSPAFMLLARITTGLPSEPASEDDVGAVSSYLGIDAGNAGLSDRIAALNQELRRQNALLSLHLHSDAILNSDDDARSRFMREVVAHNRAGRSHGKGPAA